jgi:PAS domain S-box-containing protein
MEITRKRRPRLQAVAAHYLLGIAGLALITFVGFRLDFGLARTGFVYVILVALISPLGGYGASVLLSIVAAACLNYFFAPPLFELRIHAADDIARIAAFLTTSLVVTALTTKLKRAEEESGKSKARLEEAQRIAHVGWWERDLSTGHVTVSDEVCRILGVRPVTRWLELIHPEDRARAAEAAAASLHPGGPRYDVEYRVVRSDGALRVVHSQGDVTWDDSGRPLRQFGVLQDITELRRAEQGLRQSEERFRTLVQFSFDVYWESDAEHRFTRQEFSERLADAPPPGSEIGKTRWEVPYLEPDAEGWCKHRETLDAHLPFRDFELVRPAPDGGRRYVSVSGMPVFDGTGRFVGYRGVGRHTTDRKRTENELRQNKDRLEKAERIAHVGWWERDFVTDHVSLSDEVRRIFGVRPVELPEWHGRWLTLIHPEDRSRVGEAAATALLPGGPRYDIEYRVVRPDGTERVVHSQGDVTCDETGRPLRQFGVLQDITELRHAERELRASEAKLERAQAIAHVGWWERDLTQHRVSLSDEVYRIFGLQPVDLPDWNGQRLELIHAKVIHPGDRARVAEEAAAALLPGGPRFDLEYRVVRPDGAVRIVHSQGDVTWDESGRPLRQFGALQDITELRQAEQELRASEARFRTIVDYATDAFFVFDDNSTVLDVNREACDSLGYGREELIGKRRSDFDVTLDEASIQRLKQRLVSGEAITFETRHRRKDGNSFPVEVRVGDFEQGGRRFLCLVRDITERKRAEEELRESEERFRTLVQFSFDVYWETDAQHRSIRQELAEGFAGTPLPLAEIGKTRWEVPYLEPDAEGWRKHRETLDAHLPFRDFELARPAPDGGKSYFSVSGLPVFDRSGRFIGYRGVGRHITERKRAEEALRRSEAYLAEAQRLSHTGTWAFNKTATVYWSEETYRIVGLDPVQGPPSRETMRQRIHPDDRNRVYEELREAAAQKRDFAMEFRVLLPDGTVKYLENTGHPILSARGEFVEMVGSTIDVTERRRAHEERERLRQLESDLAHVNRLSIMGELTASLAHEILHPIATARNNARAAIRFLDMSPPNMAEVREALDCIVRDADRGKDIVDRIRDHVKKAPPRNDRFDLNEAINEVIEMVRTAIDKNRVSVSTRLAADLNPVWGDRVQLQQVVMNLVLNAVEAMGSVEERAQILLIRTEQKEDGGVLVAVHDSGPGIDPEHLQRVFEPFYTTKDSGVGMGLSICRSIIDAHGGRLWADVNQPRGAVFQYILPRANTRGS